MAEKKVYKESANPVAYRSTEAVYVDGVVYKAGETFVTNKPKGSTWERLTPEEKAVADAPKEIPDDIDFTKLNATELRAYLVSKNVDPGAAKSKEDLLALVNARNEPTL